MKEGRKRAALYLRQSLDRQEQIDAQRKRCLALADGRGWEVVEVFEDNEVRASTQRGDGTAWQAMLAGIGRDFDVVVAYNLDRLLRSTKDLNLLIDLGAEVVTAEGEIDLTTADGEFRATMLAGIARFETRRARERQVNHKRARAERGLWHGGSAPYGYSLRDGKLAPSEAEVARIAEASKRLLDDHEPMHSIVTDWNNRGVRTRSGKHWRQANLRSILLNRSMLGETKAGVVGWDPIIDVRTFDRLTALLSDPSRKIVHSPGVKGGKHSMGGGLSVCAKCGKPLVTNTKTNANGPTLGCLARVHGPDARNHPRVKRAVTRNGEKVVVEQDTGRVTIGHDRLERYVFDVVTEALSQSDRWQTRMGESDPADDAKIDGLEAERAVLRDEKDRVKRAFIAGIIATEREALAEFERIDAALDAIEGQINGLLGRPVIANALADEVDWQTWTPGRRRAFLKLVLDAVIVDSWPAGMPRTRPRFCNESAEDYAVARDASMNAATARRVRIVTKWGQVL
ncbi:recombinase family protein [Microbacterium testaceum]|uniref:Recombinase family protein n=1 Tax=Microbacterium testaceum TaxID=2033 RepID=A0A2T7W9Q9_MICTE|nr:recombinase family protein [Microbacterium testaceum]PVE67921.1 hypothetical protein DC432_12235 [Microbacterium testaceum]